MPTKPQPDESKWLTTKEAAEELKVAIEHVARLCRDGALVAEKRGRDWFVSSQSAKEYVKALWEGRRGQRFMRPPHLRSNSKPRKVTT